MTYQKKYPLSMEISGRFAMFTDPSSGSDGASYPAPTQSVAKGIMEQILFIPFVQVIPTKVEICNPIRTTTIKYNYNGHLRKSDLLRKGGTCQIRETCLFDVCYKLYGVAVNIDPPESARITKRAMKYERRKINHAHSYAAQFKRRLKKGRFYRQPHLGRSDYLCDYCGPLRKETTTDESINREIPAMLVSCFNRPVHGTKVDPTFAPIKIEKGVLIYA